MEAGSGSSALVLNCRAVATAGEGQVGGCDPPTLWYFTRLSTRSELGPAENFGVVYRQLSSLSRYKLFLELNQ